MGSLLWLHMLLDWFYSLLDLDRDCLLRVVQRWHTCTHTNKKLRNRSALFRVTGVYYFHRCFVTSLLITSGRVVLCFCFRCHTASAQHIDCIKQWFLKWFLDYILTSLLVRSHSEQKNRCIWSPWGQWMRSFGRLLTIIHQFRHHYHLSISFGVLFIWSFFCQSLWWCFSLLKEVFDLFA